MNDHKGAFQAILTQLRDIFDSSEQGMYLYLDDENKECNGKFASMLGYGSAEEWAAVEENFPTAFVAEGSQDELVQKYQEAMQKATGSSFDVEWKKKTSGTIKANVILIPVAYEGHRMALHFVTA